MVGGRIPLPGLCVFIMKTNASERCKSTNNNRKTKTLCN
uniref:Uncharacterized protein n=1 Tax=Myoviridae sp. ctStS16 TaxID=2826654 RepID=A0A8S5QR85_9CAUD|nr:MAG TPA: hypothetical protein [Myoviridae sp. ctStS16]